MVKNKFFSAVMSLIIVAVTVLSFGGNIQAADDINRPEANLNVNPDSCTITHSGFTDIECNFETYPFGFIDGNILATKFEFDFIRDGVLSDGNGHTIAFNVNNDKHNLATGSELKIVRSYTTDYAPVDPFTISVNIKTNDYRSLTPGTYKGTIFYSRTWLNTQNLDNYSYSNIEWPYGTINLTLTITDPYEESGKFGDGLSWKLDNTGKLTISGNGSMGSYDYNKTPWNSFKTEIKSIDIKNGVTNIGDYAFAACTSLTTVNIPSSVKSIGERAFTGCKLIKEIVIPNGVESIGVAAFHGCSELATITVPASIQEIGSHAFTYCSKLTSFSIPESVESIAPYTFAYCYNMTSITIPDSVTSIGQNAFESAKLTSVTLPYNTTSIGRDAFSGCTKLNNVILNKDAYNSEAFPNFAPQVFRYYYDVEYSTDGHGTVSGKSISFGGDAFEVNVTPDYGYEADKIYLDYAKGKVVEISKDTAGKYTYVMPDVSGYVTVIGYFKPVSNPITITSQPVDASGVVGDTAKFKVTASGEGLSYQWQVYKNNVWKATSLPGNKTNTLQVGIVESRDGMQFRCVITNANNVTAISDEVTVTVTKGPDILSQPGDYYGFVGETAIFSVEAEGEGLKYQWQVYKNGAWKNTSLNGNRTDTLPVEITQARDGMTFRCIVKNSDNISTVSEEATIVVIEDPAIVSQPEDCYGIAGETAVFSLEAKGEGLTYQWQVFKNGSWKNTSLTGNKTDTLPVEITEARDGMTFRCIVTNAGGNSVISDKVSISIIRGPEIISQPENITGYAGETAYFNIEADGEDLSYQWQVYKNGNWKNTSITGNDSSTLTVELLESRNGMEFRCVVTNSYGVSTISYSAFVKVL